MASPQSSGVNPKDKKRYRVGNWQAHERSGWRKLHIGVDDNGYVVAETLTQNTGDGAYDTRSVYTAVGEAGGTGVEIVVPPRRPAAASPTSTPDRSVVEPCNKATAWSEG